MYSLSRDGALHAWAYAPGASSTREYAHHVAKRMKRQQGGSSATAEDGEEGPEDEEAGAAAAGSSAEAKSSEEEFPRLAGESHDIFGWFQHSSGSLSGCAGQRVAVQLQLSFERLPFRLLSSHGLSQESCRSCSF